MTITPTRARGLVDASTGDLVVITQQRITWARRGAATVNITPGFDWTCVAVGGGAVAVAGAESVAWTGPDGSTHHTAAPGSGVCRLAVAGRRVAGATREGLLTVWESLGRGSGGCGYRGCLRRARRGGLRRAPASSLRQAS